MFDRIMKTRKRKEYNQRRLQSHNELDVTLHYSHSCPLLDQHLTTYNFDSSGSSRSHSFNALSVPTPSSPHHHRRRKSSRHFMVEDMVFHMEL